MLYKRRSRGRDTSEKGEVSLKIEGEPMRRELPISTKNCIDSKLDAYILHFDRCNQRCLFCMKAYDIDNKPKLTYREVEDKIIKAKFLGYKKIDFFGGEPTLFSFLKKAVIFVQKNRMTATIATNAIKFSSNNYTKDFFAGVDIDNIGIRTSLHSNKPEVHDYITQVDKSWKKTIKGIKNILHYTKRLCVNVVITSLNYKELPMVTSFIYSLGVRGIKFSGLILYGRALMNKWLTIDISSFLPYLLEALENARKLGFYYIGVEKLPREIFKNKRLEFVHFLD